jgi:hypothetical protein
MRITRVLAFVLAVMLVLGNGVDAKKATAQGGGGCSCIVQVFIVGVGWVNITQCSTTCLAGDTPCCGCGITSSVCRCCPPVRSASPVRFSESATPFAKFIQEAETAATMIANCSVGADGTKLAV